MGKEDGYSLIELLTVTAILGFILTGIYTFYLSGLYTMESGINCMEYQQSARIAMYKIVKELRYAVWTDIPREGEIRYKKPGDTKTYLFYLIENKGELIFESKRGNLVYSHNKVALGITDLKFWSGDNDCIHVSVSAGDWKQSRLRTSVFLRNLAREG